MSAGELRQVAIAASLVERARIVAESPNAILGIAGPPGSGKSTLAMELVARLNEAGPFAAYVPMDGFHLSNARLDDLGLGACKGHPSTFDAAGFVVALGRIRARTGTVYVPTYSRTLHEPIAGSLAVDSQTRLAVVEGNYLLLEEEPWSFVRPLLDEVWYLDASLETLEARLVERQIAGGRTASEARSWVASSDLVNVRLVDASKHHANRIVETS